MTERSTAPALHDLIEAIEHIVRTLAGVSLQEFQEDLDKRRIVERNVEIISEASRRLAESVKDRGPDIPWRKVAGIGNILRHDYENVIPDALWKLAQDDLPALERVCRAALREDESRR